MWYVSRELFCINRIIQMQTKKNYLHFQLETSARAESFFFCCLNRKSCNVHFCCCPNHGIVISTCNNYEMRIEWSICPFFIFSLNWFDGLQFCNCSVSAKPYITSHCNHLSFMVVRMHLFQFKTIRFVTFSALLFGRSLTTPYRGGCYSCLVHVVTL